MTIAQSIFKLNFLSLWAREVEVWGKRMTASSLDRLLNLCLHHFGVRGMEEKRFLEGRLRPGMHVLDIGANQGLYSLLISDIVGDAGRVHSFEPDPTLFASLQINCERNRAANIQLHNVAVGGTAGLMKLYRSRVNSGDNRLARSPHPEWFEEVEVRVAAVDSIITGERIDFIKIDVQGWEYQVLQGMQQLLRNNPDVQIYFEYWPYGLENAGCPPLELLRYIDSQGFSIYQEADTALRPLTDFEGLTQSLRGKKYVDLFAMRRAPTTG